MSVTRTKIIKIRATDDEYAELVARSTKPKLAEWMRDTCLARLDSVRGRLNRVEKVV